MQLVYTQGHYIMAAYAVLAVHALIHSIEYSVDVKPVAEHCLAWRLGIMLGFVMFTCLFLVFCNRPVAKFPAMTYFRTILVLNTKWLYPDSVNRRQEMALRPRIDRKFRSIKLVYPKQ
jgi:hypothetical protein